MTNSRRNVSRRRGMRKGNASTGLPRTLRLPGAELTVRRRNTFALAKTASDTGRLISCTVNDFGGSEIQSIFHLYRIEKLNVTWTLVNAPNNNATFPTLHVAPQNFTFITPSSLAEMGQYDKVRIYQFGPSKVQFKESFVPSVLVDASATAGTGQVVLPGRTPFLSSNNVNVNFIAANYWIQRYNATDATHTIEVTVEAVITLKGSR